VSQESSASASSANLPSQLWREIWWRALDRRVLARNLRTRVVNFGRSRLKALNASEARDPAGCTESDKPAGVCFSREIMPRFLYMVKDQ
jgi:hypothetical protein